MKKIKAIAGTLLVVLVLFFCIEKLNYFFRPTKTDGGHYTIDTFHNLPKDSVEVIVFGSSHALRGINVMEMYKNYGIGAYDYAWNWQKINTTRLFVEDALMYQTPKLVMIESVYISKLKTKDDLNGEVFYTKYLDKRVGKVKYLRQVFGDNIEGYFSYFVPMCAFHDKWEKIDEEFFTESDYKESVYPKTMGFFPSQTVVELENLPKEGAKNQTPIDPVCMGEVDEIVKMCKEKGVKVLFYNTPYQGHYSHVDALEEYAKENDCDYVNLVDYIDEMGLDGSTDFYDKGHLNTSGATKVADFLGKYIFEHYDLTDMRTVEGNAWEIALGK